MEWKHLPLQNSISILSRNFFNLYRIVKVLSGKEIFALDNTYWALNNFYLLTHHRLFKTVLLVDSNAIETKRFLQLLEDSKLSEFTDLQQFNFFFEISSLTENIITYLDPVLFEAKKLCVEYGISSSNYLWLDMPLSEVRELIEQSDESFIKSGMNPADMRGFLESVLSEMQFQKELDSAIECFDQKNGLENKSGRIRFDKTNWSVYNNGRHIWTLKKGNREYRLFELLFDKMNEEQRYDSILTDLDIWVISKIPIDYLSDIKSKMPKDIKGLIGSTNWGYIIYGNKDI